MNMPCWGDFLQFFKLRQNNSSKSVQFLHVRVQHENSCSAFSCKNHCTLLYGRKWVHRYCRHLMNDGMNRKGCSHIGKTGCHYGKSITFLTVYLHSFRLVVNWFIVVCCTVVHKVSKISQRIEFFFLIFKKLLKFWKDIFVLLRI